MLRAAAMPAAPAAKERLVAPRVRVTPLAAVQRLYVTVKAASMLLKYMTTASPEFHLSPVALVSPSAAVVGSFGK